jgi:hypothetical protein
MKRTIVIAGSAVVAACATGPNTHTELAFSGRIEGRIYYEEQMGVTMGCMMVAPGVFSAPVPMASKQAAEFRYSVQTASLVLVGIPSDEKFEVGQCVGAYVKKSDLTLRSWQRKQISLRASDQCR